MRFEEQIHWSEGLFLQPHHFQRLQNGLSGLLRASRDLVQPFGWGFFSLQIDDEALKSRRVVVTHFEALLPDGQELSMPDNCELAPLTLTRDDQTENDITVYLALPLWTASEPNVASTPESGTRFILTERQVSDENTAENRIPLVMRRCNVFLTTDAKLRQRCTLMPLAKVTWGAVNAGLPTLSPVETYMPPYVLVTAGCPLLPMISELLFQLKSCRSSIQSELENGGYDAKMLAGLQVIEILKLQTLNKFIYRLEHLVVPDRSTPFALYLELLSLLGELEISDPLRRSEPLPPYDHDDALPCFSRLMTRIRALILKSGTSHALRFEFTKADHPYLEMSCEDERIFTAPEVFIALEIAGSARERVADVEEGDNFRLIDERSFTDRVRGIKLSELRYPPQYLPDVPGAVWFKVLKEQTPRIWGYIAEDHKMIIDYAEKLFPGLKASLFVSIKKQAGDS